MTGKSLEICSLFVAGFQQWATCQATHKLNLFVMIYVTMKRYINIHTIIFINVILKLKILANNTYIINKEVEQFAATKGLHCN